MSREIIERLKENNRLYVASGKCTPNVSKELRSCLASGQAPYAAVLTCSDSRVIPEAIFLANLGDLFVIRVAGNIADHTQMASIVYAVEHLGVDTVVVLGHTNCGAVAAALHGEVDGEVGYITRKIQAVIGPERNALAACRLNVLSTVRIVSDSLGTNAQCIGAIYDIVSGKVEFLE